jgi:hypothetical protein
VIHESLTRYSFNMVHSYSAELLAEIAAKHGVAMELSPILGKDMPSVVINYPTGEREVLMGAPTEIRTAAYFYALAAEIALLGVPDGEEAELLFTDQELLDLVIETREDDAADLEHNAWRLTAFPIFATP